MICCKLWWKLEWSWGGIPLQSVKPSCSPPTSIMSLAVPHSPFCSRIHSPPRHIQILVPLPQSTALSSPWSLNPGPEAGTSQAVLSQKYDCTRWIHSTFDCELSALGMASLWARPALILLVERILNDRIWTELAGCLVGWCLKLSFILGTEFFPLFSIMGTVRQPSGDSSTVSSPHDHLNSPRPRTWHGSLGQRGKCRGVAL